MNEISKVWYKKWWAILLFILAALIIILATTIYLKIKQNAKIAKNPDYTLLSANPLSPEKQILVEGSENHWTGTTTPKITIVEFGDYACTYCQKAQPKIREISLKYKDSVKYIFRDYPINTEQSLKLAIAARCAGEQNMFWQAHDKIFQNPGLSSDADIKKIIKTIGVKVEKFDSCYDGQKYLTEIKKDLTDGQRLGITGTPTWFINGNMIKGDIPYDTFTKIIEEIINQNSNNKKI